MIYKIIITTEYSLNLTNSIYFWFDIFLAYCYYYYRLWRDLCKIVFFCRRDVWKILVL